MYAGVDGVYKNQGYAESGTIKNEPSHSTSMESDKKVVASHKHIFYELLFKIICEQFYGKMAVTYQWELEGTS